MSRNGVAPAVKHLFSDASCSHYAGIAAWAARLIVGDRIIERSGLIGAKVTCSTSAEAEGVHRAMSAFARAGMISRGDTIIIYCDNQAVCSLINSDRWKKRPKRNVMRVALESVHLMARQFPLALIADWVPSHQAEDSPDWRAEHNREVDRAARRIVKARRIDLKKEGKADG